jgi:hypothetical protein
MFSLTTDPTNDNFLPDLGVMFAGQWVLFTLWRMAISPLPLLCLAASHYGHPLPRDNVIFQQIVFHGMESNCSTDVCTNF